MNRRAFLTGLVASSAIAACPAAVEAALTAAPAMTWEQWYERWVIDASAVISDAFVDQIIFGVGAYKQCDEYPYVKRIDPRTLPRIESPYQFQGLL